MFCARSCEQIAAGADCRRLIPTLTPACVARTSSSFKFDISERGARAGVFTRRRVSRGDIHSTRAGSTIASPAYVGRFEWSTYVGRLRAPALMTRVGRSPRDQAKACQEKCRELTRTASGFVIAREKYFSISCLDSFGLRLDIIDFRASSLQYFASANANRSTSLSQFGFVHTHLRGIRRATTRGCDATGQPRTLHARPRAATAAPRSGGRANETVTPSRFAKPRRVQKTRVGGKIYISRVGRVPTRMTSHEPSIYAYFTSFSAITPPRHISGCTSVKNTFASRLLHACRVSCRRARGRWSDGRRVRR